MVGSIGLGTFFTIILLIILVILLVLYIIGIPPIKYIFWIYLVLLVIVFAVIFTLPYDNGIPVDETNSHFPTLVSFAVFIFLGLVVSIVLYVFGVLLYEDKALVLPKFWKKIKLYFCKNHFTFTYYFSICLIWKWFWMMLGKG